MPPTGTLLSPTGARVTASPAVQLDRIAALRAEALETPIGAEWTARDRWDYMRHLDKTEAALKAQENS